MRKAKINILKKAREISSFKEGENHLLFDRILEEVFELFPTFLETINSFNQLLKHFPNTKLILVGYDISLVGRTISCLAQKHQIKTATIQHGSNQSKLLKYSIADYNFVFGNYFKNALDIITDNKVKVIAVGSPKFENYFDESYRSQTLKSLDFIKSKNPFLVALSGSGHSISEKNHIAIIAVLEKVVILHDNQHFIFKLHPKDDKRYYERLIQYENVTVVSRDYRCYEEVDFPEWIKICKGLITGASAAAFEAFILKKHVITIDLLGEIKRASFVSEGVSYHCQSPEDVNYAIDSIVSRDKRCLQKTQAIEVYVKDKFCADGNPPSKKIANFIEQIILT